MSSTIRRVVVLLIALTVVGTLTAPVFAQLGVALVRAQVLDETLRARTDMVLHEEPHRARFFPFVWDSPPTEATIETGDEVRVVGLKQTSAWGRRSVWLEVQSVNEGGESGWIGLGSEGSALATVWTQWEPPPEAPEEDQ